MAAYLLDCSILQSTLSKTDTFGTGTKCPSYRESNKGSKERQGPSLGVRFTEVSVKRESTLLLNAPELDTCKISTPFLSCGGLPIVLRNS